MTTTNLPRPAVHLIAPALIALIAALITQIAHEFTHAAAMLLVGSGVEAFHLFAVRGQPIVDQNAQLIISGSAAVVNVIIGLLALALYYLTALRKHPRARLFVFYLTAFMLMTGFGYFMVDALFYAPDAPFFPDWQYVIHILGGGWEVRLPLLLVGSGGLMALFFWLPNAALRFVSDPIDRTARQREMFALTLLPYLLVNIALTLASPLHPLGVQGMVITLVQYWFGYIALAWAFPIGGLWTDVKTLFSDHTPLPATRALPAWAIGGLGVMLALSVALLLGIGG